MNLLIGPEKVLNCWGVGGNYLKLNRSLTVTIMYNFESEAIKKSLNIKSKVNCTSNFGFWTQDLYIEELFVILIFFFFIWFIL